MIRVLEIGNRQFLDVEDVLIPIDRIRKIDFNCANGGASGRSVQIVTDDPSESIFFAFENRDRLWKWLASLASYSASSAGEEDC